MTQGIAGGLLMADVRAREARGELTDDHLDHLAAWLSARFVASIEALPDDEVSATLRGLADETRGVLRRHGREVTR